MSYHPVGQYQDAMYQAVQASRGATEAAAVQAARVANAAAETAEPATAEAGMLGVPWKWWLIGSAALGGAWLLLRKKST